MDDEYPAGDILPQDWNADPRRGADVQQYGFGIGPGAGHLIADIVSGVAPIVDPKPYHPSRFASSAWGKVAEF